ncbi:hypothetical protein N7519_003387 [Penicillium mononematosum]|uniref:uncharacterized protein n=1 Tax=Penicillium mononematosum TaxID=268346 RepID=UPI0025495CB7|nr:uncharacterized protein N7519_003387 [Penicillium mononematosum]KAJ6188479.1 hypothetical protein N7519_003387 [Penicillium mononematosum]
MISTIHNPDASLIAQLVSPPNISLQILGTHSAGEQTQVVDFDLWIDCSKQAKIKSGEFLTGNEDDHRSWEQSDDSNDSFSTTSSGWLQGWLGDSSNGTRYSLQSCLSLHDDDSVAVKAHAESLARNVAYGGSIIVEIHTPPLEADVAGNTAEIRAEWSFGSPFVPVEQSWDHLVMNAMVDCRRGFISVDEPRPSHGRSPLRRAMKSNNTSTVVSQVQNEGIGHTSTTILAMGI